MRRSLPTRRPGNSTSRRLGFLYPNPEGLAFRGGTDYVPRAGAPPMTQTLIDTLRFAGRLDEAGFAAAQAEAPAPGMVEPVSARFGS